MMGAFFALLFFLFGFLVIVGLVKPSWVIRWGTPESKTRKKVFLTGIPVMVLCIILSPTSEKQSDTVPITQPVTSQQQAKPAEPTPPPAETKPANTETKEENPICKTAGIGDTVTLFEKAYGKATIKLSNHTFQNDKIVVLPLNNRAWNIMIDTKNKDKTQSWNELLGFLPTDMQIVKESKKDDGMIIKFITFGISQKLAKVSPQSEGGKFLVIRNFDKKTNKNIGSVIGVGHNP